MTELLKFVASIDVSKLATVGSFISFLLYIIWRQQKEIERQRDEIKSLLNKIQELMQGILDSQVQDNVQLTDSLKTVHSVLQFLKGGGNGNNQRFSRSSHEFPGHVAGFVT